MADEVDQAAAERWAVILEMRILIAKPRLDPRWIDRARQAMRAAAALLSEDIARAS